MNNSRSSSNYNARGGAHLPPRGSAKASSGHKKKKQGAGKKVAAVFIVLFVLLAGAFVSLGFVAKASNTIYPNLQVGGIQAGGMSVQALQDALESAGLDDYDGKSVTVQLTEALDIRISSQEAEVGMQLDKAAQEAYNYGRDGGFIGNTIKYIGCLFGQKDLPLADSFSINEARVRELISQAAVRLLAGDDEAYTLGEKQITLVKSTEGLSIDEDAVYDLVYSAFAHQDYSPISYTPTATSQGDGIDMQKLYDAVFKEPADAYYDKESAAVVPSVTGISFDVKKAQSVYDAAASGETVKIDLILEEPKLTTEALEDLLFRDLLASKTTSLTSDTGRSKNIELAAAEVHETVLMPGEVFDYNSVVGERTRERGYSAAAAYVGKEVVQEVGGGICQVSSTIYYATLYARLDTVYRTCHRYASSYVPLGMDATVSWGGPEFKFENSSEYPIKILAYINWNGNYRSSLTVEIYGTKWDDRYVEMSYTYTGSVPFETEYIDDPNLPLGEEVVEKSGYAGTRVDTYRSVYEADGTLAYTEYIDSSSYYGGDAVIRRGTGENVSPSPSPSEDPTPSPSPSENPSPEPTPSEDPSPSPTSTPTDSPSPSPETPAA